MIEPTPEPEARAARKQSAKRTIRLMGIFALIVAALAAWLVHEASPGASIHMLIATAILAGGTIFMGTTLMTLAFYSSSSGHDIDAQYSPDNESDPE